jgi:hypothetical protein
MWTGQRPSSIAALRWFCDASGKPSVNSDLSFFDYKGVAYLRIRFSDMKNMARGKEHVMAIPAFVGGLLALTQELLNSWPPASGNFLLGDQFGTAGAPPTADDARTLFKHGLALLMTAKERAPGYSPKSGRRGLAQAGEEANVPEEIMSAIMGWKLKGSSAQAYKEITIERSTSAFALIDALPDGGTHCAVSAIPDSHEDRPTTSPYRAP